MGEKRLRQRQGQAAGGVRGRGGEIVRSTHSHRFPQRLAQPAARESKDDGNAVLARFLDYFFYLVVKAPFALCVCVCVCVHMCACVYVHVCTCVCVVSTAWCIVQFVRERGGGLCACELAYRTGLDVGGDEHNVGFLSADRPVYFP